MLSWARYRRDGDWPTDSGERGGVARGGSDGGERGPRGPVAVLPGLPPFLVTLGGGFSRDSYRVFF
jgi:hypothetical protein